MVADVLRLPPVPVTVIVYGPGVAPETGGGEEPPPPVEPPPLQADIAPKATNSNSINRKPRLRRSGTNHKQTTVASTAPEWLREKAGSSALEVPVVETFSVEEAAPFAVVTCVGVMLQLGNTAAVPEPAQATLQPTATVPVNPPAGVILMVEVTNPPEEAIVREAGFPDKVKADSFPSSETVCGELAALSAITNVAESAKPPCVEYTTLIEQPAPAASEVGQLLVSTNWFVDRLISEIPIDEMLSAATPEFVRVTDCGALVPPSVATEKARMGGDRVTAAAGPVPVPLRGTVCGDCSPLSVNVSAALLIPSASGEKLTVTVQLAPEGTKLLHVVVSGNSEPAAIEAKDKG